MLMHWLTRSSACFAVIVILCQDEAQTVVASLSSFGGSYSNHPDDIIAINQGLGLGDVIVM